MNQILYYGGFALAAALFVLALLFFILFRVPAIHRYFRGNSRRGLVAAEAVTGRVRKKPEGPKRLTRAEYESRTRVITLFREDTAPADPDRTSLLAAGRMDTRAAEAEDPDKTELL